MNMVVFDQYWLVPMALTIDATQEGPEPSLIFGWSEERPSGITQLTAGNCPSAISVNSCVF